MVGLLFEYGQDGIGYARRRHGNAQAILQVGLAAIGTDADVRPAQGFLVAVAIRCLDEDEIRRAIDRQPVQLGQLALQVFPTLIVGGTLFFRMSARCWRATSPMSCVNVFRL